MPNKDEQENKTNSGLGGLVEKVSNAVNNFTNRLNNGEGDQIWAEVGDTLNSWKQQAQENREARENREPGTPEQVQAFEDRISDFRQNGADTLAAARVDNKAVSDLIKEEVKKTGTLDSKSDIYGKFRDIAESAESTDTKNLKRKNVEFSRNNKAWANTNGTTGSKRNEIDKDGAYHWKGHTDESGNFISGFDEWVADDQARIQSEMAAQKAAYDDRKARTEEEVQAHQQECANIYYDVSDLEEYAQDKLDEFMAKYDQTYQYASEEEKKALDDERSILEHNQEVYKNWKETAKGMYEDWVGLNEYYGHFDESNKYKIDGPDADVELFAETEYMTPEMIREEIENLDAVIESYKGEKTKEERDLRAEALTRQDYLENTLLPAAEDIYRQYKEANDDLDVIRENYLFAPEEGWNWVDIERDLVEQQNNAVLEADRQAIQKNLDFVHRRMDEDTKKSYKDKWKDASASEIADRMVAIQYDIPTDTSPSATTEAAASVDYDNLAKLEKEHDDKVAEYAKFDSTYQGAAKEKTQKKQELWNDIQRLETEINTIKATGPIAVPDQKNDKFAYSFFDKPTEREMSSEEALELEALQELYREKTIAPYEAMFVAGVQDTTNATGAAWVKKAEEAVAKAQESLSPLLTNDTALQKAQEEVHSMGRISDKTVEDLKAAGIYDDLMNYLDKDTSDRTFEEKLAAFSAMNTGANTKASDEYARAVMELSWARSLEAYELTHSKDYADKVAKGAEKAKAFSDVLDKAMFFARGQGANPQVVLQQAGISEEDAKELTTMFVALGIDKDMYTPRVKGTDKEKVSLLDNILSIFKTENYDAGAERGYFTEEQYNAYLYYLGNDDPVGAVKYALSVNSNINDAYKADIAHRYELRSKLYGEEDGTIGSIKNAIFTPVIASPLIMTGVFDTVKNIDQLLKLGQTYSSANFSLMEQGELMGQAAMGALTVGKTQKTADVINFFYGAYRSAVQSAETLAFGGLIANAIGATASTIVNLPLAKAGINAERLVTGAFSDITFFGSAAASTYKELKSAGVDDKVAMVASLASGINEALFEHVSIDNLYKIKNFQSWGTGWEAAKNLIFTTAQQGLIEGSEEFATSLANFISQKVILGDASDFDRSVTAYMEQYRIPRDQAVKFASQDLAREWAVEFAAGVVSGAAGAGFRGATSYIGDRAQYRGYREAVGKLYNETQFGDKTAAQMLGEYLYDYDFIQGKDESQFTAEMLDSVDDIHELAEKVKDGTATNEEIGRMVTITENFDPDILIDLAGAHPEWYAVVEPYKFLAAYQKKTQALLGSQAEAYMKAVANAAQSGEEVYIASNFEEHLRNSGIELSEKDMHDLTSFLEEVLVGSTTVNENAIRNAFREGPLADPKVQMAVWSYLSLSMDENQGQGYDQELYETILPLLQNSGEVTVDNVSTELANTLVGTWDYLRRANDIEATQKRAIAASAVAQAEAGRATSKLVQNLAANRSDNDFVRVNGKDVTRKEFVAAAANGKNAITGEDLPFGALSTERANNYFDGRIIAYAMAPQSQGEAFTEKFDLLTGQVRDEETIKRLQERIAQMKKGAANKKQGRQTGKQSSYTLPKEAVDKTQAWVQSTEEELEKAIPQLKSEIENLTNKQKDLYNTRTLLAGSADAETKKANKAAITKVTAELKAKQTQLKNAERDLAVLKARKGRQNEALSSGTSERGDNANVGGATGTVQSGQVGSAQTSTATGSQGVRGTSSGESGSGRGRGRGRESVNAAGVEMENGYILFDSKSNSNEDDLTSTELALLNRAKELGAERVIFVNAENTYNEDGDRIAGVYDTIAKTLVYNANTDNRHCGHEVDHILIGMMSEEERKNFLDNFVTTTFKNRKKLFGKLFDYYASVYSNMDKYGIYEEIFCDMHNGLDRMAQLEGKSLITDEDLQMFKDRAERYIKSSGVEEQIKAKLGTGTAQATEQKAAPQSQIVGTNNMTVNSEEDFQAVQNALMKLKDKESFFFKYNGQQYVVTVDESKDYGTSYKVAQTVSPSQIFNAKSIGSSDTANGALDIVRNGSTTTESAPTEQTEAKAEETKPKKKSSKKKQEFETEENLRATNSNSEFTRKSKNGKTLVERRKWTDKITNPVTEEGTLTRAEFVKKATEGWPELDDIGEPTTMTMAEAQDAFDEWKAAQTPSKKNSILKDYGVDLEEINSAGLDNLIAQISNDYEVAAQQERDAMSGWNARDYADLSPEEYWDAYHEWWEANNIEEIKNRRERLSSALRRAQAERNWRAIDPASLMQTAKDMFGTTDDFNKAGFILPDGTLLDMSEGHEKRTMFHNDAAQEVLRSLGQPVSDAIDKFVGRGGAIRIDLGSDGIDIPQSGITKDQYNTLREFLDQHINTPDYGRNKFYVMTMGLNTQNSGVFNPSNPSQIINGIRQYYNTGEFPQLSSTSAYHYSILDDIKSDTKSYGPGVLFDSNKFTNGEDWADIANDYVQSMAGQTIVAHDIDTGEDVNLLIANSSQTHRKGNNTGTTRTIGELKINANDKERGVEENKARFLIHLPEVVQVARSNHPFTRPQGPTHGYVDSKGWRYYRVYGMDMDGNIYAAFLNIAQGALGDTLYTITAYPKPIDRNTHVQGSIENEPLGASDSTMTSEEPTGMATSRDSMFDILSQKFNVVKNIDKKYSILGMNAKGADFGKLSTAVDMELNGSTENEIWKKTGWFRGMDGEWKFEIYDGDFDLNMDLIKRMRRDYAVNKNQTMDVTLGDILKGADILFDNYPQLKSVPVSFARLGEGIEGRVTRDNGALLSHRYLNSVSRSYGARADLLSTIMHETQHLIQGIEKFAGGASETFWENEQDAWRDFAEKEVFNPRSQAELDLEAASRYDPAMFDTVTQLADLRDQARNGDIDTKVYERQLAKVTKRYRPFDVAQILYDYDVIQYLEDNDYTNWLNESPEDLYDNTAGEIEARDVEDRLTMTPRQRRANRPNTPVESAIFSEIPAAPASRNRYSVLEDRGNVGYNEPNGGIANDTRRSSEEDTGRTSSLYGDLDTNAEGRGGLGGLSETTGSVRLSNQSIQAIKDSGIVYVEINPTTDNAAFSMRLDEARDADPDHGWAVSPKSVDDIEEYNLRLFMSADGSTGFAIAPDGDIEAVFRNQLTGTRKSTMSSLPLAIANGGTKLDCYGTGLLNFYTQYGFIPVARVTFNPEYANPGWTPEKGYPDIIFMMHNGDSADEIIQNHGKYHVYTAEEIAALPLYDKEGYMDAYDFRDKELTKLQAESTPQQRKYSVLDERHNEFAPVFYSKMQQTIEEWTGGNGQKLGSKMAAGSVVSWLKGKGVKDEEIKWSGINQYLEGKKSVTQEELLQVMKENEYKIETKVLADYDSDGGWVYHNNATNKSTIVKDPNEALETARENAIELGFDPDSVYLDIRQEAYFAIEDGEEYIVLPIIKRKPDHIVNTNWGEYTLPGNINYREILFKNPGNDYSNHAMEVHWNESNKGVLAHARVDDMESEDGKRVLFIEEIQSDWHNAGAKSGFGERSQEEIEEAKRKYETESKKQKAYESLIDSAERSYDENYSAALEVYDRIAWELRNNYPDLIGLRRVSSVVLLSRYENGDRETPFRRHYDGEDDLPSMQRAIDSIISEQDKHTLAECARAKADLEELYDLRQEAFEAAEEAYEKYNSQTAPDAPFAGASDTYHEYVMKHLLRLAAEGGYERIGWTTAQQQSDRWSNEYAEGYRIEYDQNIPKFMKKYVKQWGATVGKTNIITEGTFVETVSEEIWSVDITPQMRDDVLFKGQPKYSILETAKEVSDTYNLDLSDLDLADILLLSPEELLELDRALGISESSYDTEYSEEDTIEEPEEEIEEEEPYIQEERRPSRRVENGERNPTAFLKQETLNKWLSGSGFASPMPKNYAQAYIGWMHPDDFLFLSTGSYEVEDQKRAEGYYGDEENISQRAQSGYRADTIYLRLDHENGKLYGHEGRHRMDFLQRLGVENVPVLFFDDSNKYDKEVIHNPTLIGEWNNNRRVTLDTDLIPLNENNRAIIEAEFVNREGENPNKPTVRFSILAKPEETYDAFGDQIQLDSYNLADLTTSDLSDKLYYSSDGNTAYYQTEDGQTVVLQNIGEDSPEAQYIRYLEAMNNANDTNTTATKPYIIPPRSRYEDNGYSLGEQNAGLRRGTEEVPETLQEGTLRRRGSSSELYGQSRPQSEAEESVRRYSILVGPNEKSNRGDTTFQIVNDQGETITTADIYPLESFERHLLTAVRDDRLTDMEDVINEWFDRGGRIGDDSWTVLADEIKENQNYTDDEKKALYAAIEKARKTYGDLAKGRDDKKPNVILPKKADNGDGTTRNIRKNIQTTAANVDNELLTESLMFKAMNDEMMGYTPQSNPETVQKARDMIKNQFNGSFDAAYNHFRALKESGKLPSAVDIALGEILIKEFGDGDKHPDSMNKAINVAADLAILGTDLGQAIQALRIIKKATPQGQLYYLDGVVKRLNATYAQRIKDGKMTPVEIKEALAAKLLSASTRQELNDAIEAIKEDLASQIPVTLWDQWNAWRYLAMLGNPRTHIRNFFGNAFFMPIVFVKDMALRRLQNENSISNRLLSAAMGGEIIGDEFRTMVSGADLSGWLFKNNSNPYVKFARDDYQIMQDIVKGKKSGSKYSDANDIISRRKVFENGPIKSKFLQKYNDFNSEWLEREDTGFQEKYYVRYLAEYLQAQGVTEDQLTGDSMFSTTPEGRKLLNRARQYATLQAQRDTYHEMNQFAMELNRLKGKGGWRYVLGEGLVPFTGTPANLLKLAAVQYSPYGLMRSIVDLKRAIREGNKDTAAILDNLASGLTGTGLILLGAALAAGGLGFKLRGAGPDDDKEAEFEEMQGHQSWSIETDKWSYTIDWMAPLCMPLFVGATMYELFNREIDLSKPSAFSTLLFGIANPMLSMSMLDGIENTLSSLKYGGKNAMATLAASMLTSYFAQGMPTIAGQMARSLDDRRRATYIDPNSKWPGEIQRFWQSSIQNKIPDFGKLFGKDWIPFSEDDKIEYVDMWGRNQMTGKSLLSRMAQNFLSPGYFRWIDETAVDDELFRLYEAIGGTEGKGALPTSVGKEIGKQNQGKDDNGEPIVIDGKKLTAEEYVTRQKVKGQTAYAILSDMFNDELYKNATDNEKLKMIDEAYKFAESLADQAVIPERNMAASWMDTAKRFGVSDYILIKQDYDNNKSNDKVYDWILSTPDLTTDQMAILFADKFSVPDYIDSEATGYRYKMLNADEEPLTALNETILQQRLPELFSNQRFIDADPDEKAIRLKEFISDIRDETLQNYSNMLSTTSREYTLGKASRLSNDQKFEVMLDAKDGDHREQANWIADSFKADKVIDNPDHMGYEFELDDAETGEGSWMYDRVHELYADAYDKLWTDNEKFKGAVARNDKQEMAAIAHDTWNAVVQQAETEYGHMLNQNGTGKERFKETPTGYSSIDAYKIAREKYGDDYKAIGRYIAQTVDNHTTIEDPEKPGYFIVLNSAEQAQGKKDRTEMFAELFATEAQKDYFKIATDEEKEAYIKGFISAVDKDYQKQYAEKIKKAGYDTELTKKLNTNDTSAKEFLDHMAKNSYSKEETVDIMMARYKVDHDLQDVNYNPAGRVLQMNAARKYYEDNYEAVKSGAMTWEDYRKNASTEANKAASGAFGVKSVGKIPAPEYNIPGINPSFPSDTGSVAIPNPSKVTNNFWSNLIRR